MQIFGPFRVSTAAATSTGPAGGASRPTAATPPARGTAAPVDQLDLSSSVGGVNRLDAASGPVAGDGEIRIDRVAELRRQIADGGYDTSEKMDAALDRMLDAWG